MKTCKHFNDPVHCFSCSQERYRKEQRRQTRKALEDILPSIGNADLRRKVERVAKSTKRKRTGSFFTGQVPGNRR